MLLIINNLLTKLPNAYITAYWHVFMACRKSIPDDRNGLSAYPEHISATQNRFLRCRAYILFTQKAFEARQGHISGKRNAFEIA
jgi:hypothetical protein